MGLVGVLSGGLGEDYKEVVHLDMLAVVLKLNPSSIVC